MIRKVSGVLMRRLLGQRARVAPGRELPATVYVWSIGAYTGPSCLEFSAPGHIRNPVLTGASVSDVSARSVADPFALHVDGRWYMFFEVVSEAPAPGMIGLATSRDGTTWTYERIVLREPFHLSYPYVFESEGEYYMIPECHETGSVRLYRARRFPDRWAMVETLLRGPVLLDPSIVRHAGRWWLFVETNPAFTYDTLRLFSAQTLRGPWSEHPASPVIAGDPHVARPGGRITVAGGRILRYAQDCAPVYGWQVRAFEITQLAVTGYEERSVGRGPILGPGGNGWNRSGMHHIDPHPLPGGTWRAYVDGWYLRCPGTP